ncbi:uncharacterized protein ZSWIM9-like [Protopterus annectens]|uniref:uncharacterized protein ZSWIM9-like n=1 Tax=Protopterus annectens TaxID=7888 RepID=UPI001CFB922A|nr:uncharacterized protein ZSWIM9-like [Protopterus annectens]XP_043934326.1 uncharacterized protein ZSWIM9-like [Protopterus annectens]
MSEPKNSSALALPEILPDHPREECTVMVDDISEKKFSSWEEFCTFFDSWCEKNKVLFFKKSGVLLGKYKESGERLDPELVEMFKFNRAFLACKYYRADGGLVQSSNGDYRSGCPAYIILKLDTEEKKLVVTKAVLVHNHKLCPIEFANCFRRGRYLGDALFVIRMTNKMERQFLGVQDIRKLKVYLRKQDPDLRYVIERLGELFVVDPAAKVKLAFVENHCIMKYAILITSNMKNLCLKFSRVLYLSKITHMSDEFDFYTMLCEDANGRGRECVCCIAKKDTPNIFRFILVSLVQSVPEIKYQVNCLIIENYSEELDVIRDLLPKAQIQFCRTWVLETLYNKAIEMEGFFHDNIWDLLCNLANSSSPSSYADCLRKMKTVFCKGFVQYFKSTWHPYKEMWVESWAFEPSKGNVFRNLVSAHQQLLASELHSTMKFADYVKIICKLQTQKAETVDFDEVEVSKHYHEICPVELADLVDEEISAAKSGCFKIRNHSDCFLLSDGTSDYTVNQEQTSCSCTIFALTLSYCRHIFAARLWSGESLFSFPDPCNNISTKCKSTSTAIL